MNKCNESNFLEVLDDCIDTVYDNCFGDRNVYPYSFPVNVVDFLERMKDFDSCTYMSKWVLIEELNGFIEHCLNPWLEYEKKPKVRVKLNNGNEMEVTKELSEVIVSENLGTLL